jgi:hypothetical protein
MSEAYHPDDSGEISLIYRGTNGTISPEFYTQKRYFVKTKEKKGFSQT